MTFNDFLMQITPALTIKVLSTLGIGYITHTQFTNLFSQFNEKFLRNYNELPADILNFLNLAGFSQAFFNVMAAFAVVASLKAVKRLGVLPDNNGG